MSQELTKYTAPTALSIPQEEMVALQEAYAINIANGSVSEFDLPRIKVMNGAALWNIPTLEGEMTAQRIEGVIVNARDQRIYYASKDAGNVPPNCSSLDGITGTGKPGGKCADCPHAKWESAQDGAGQACKQVKHLFMLRGEAQFPEIVSLPPTSVKAARQFFLKLTTQGVPYTRALIAIDLEKAENAAKKPYGRAVFRFLRRLTPEEAARALDFHEMTSQFAARMPADAAAARTE